MDKCPDNNALIEYLFKDGKDIKKHLNICHECNEDVKSLRNIENKLKNHRVYKETDKICMDPEWLGGYIEGRLSREEKKKVERHISNCDNCLDEIILLKKLLKNREPAIPEYIKTAGRQFLDSTFSDFSINCFKCGGNISEGNKVCPHCGMKIIIEEEEEKELWNNIKLWLPDFLQENKWLMGAIVAFAASFAFTGAVFQLLFASGIMGGLWIFEKGKKELLKEIKEALEKGEKEKVVKLVEELRGNIGGRLR
jgi:hypothetical protein